MICRFIIKDRETFFTAAQRSQVVWQIMMRAKYDDSEKVRCENMLNKSLIVKRWCLYKYKVHYVTVNFSLKNLGS